MTGPVWFGYANQRTYDCAFTHMTTEGDWDDFRFFLAVARERRLLRAARRLGVEHTTVARRLAAFEARLGGPLFHRTTRGHILTREGRAMLAEAEAIERSAARAWSSARGEVREIEGEVRLAIIESFAAYWLLPRLGTFVARHPRVRLRLLTGNEQSDLARGEAELAVRTPRPARREYTAVRLATATVGLFASPAFARKKHAFDLDADPPITGGLPLYVYDDALRFMQSAPWFERVLARTPPIVVTNSTHALVGAAQADLGVIVVPRFIARAAGLVAVSARSVSRHDLWLVGHPDFRRDPRVAAVWSFLREIAGGLADAPVRASTR